MHCPKCGTQAPEGAKFCELDGTRLIEDIDDADITTATISTSACGGCRCGADANAIDAQGYCQECGRFCGGKERDHIEITLGSRFAGVTDRGQRHPRNEDDLILARVAPEKTDIARWDGQILIVCDGVSSSETPDTASRTACTAALEFLTTAVQQGWDRDRAEDTMREAIKTANHAVSALPHTPNNPKDPPETTIVVAVVIDRVVTLGWVGDSRAYWFGKDLSVAQQLTRDHSWLNDVVDAGEMSEEEASKTANAHAITRCLGVPDHENEDGEATQPDVSQFALPGPGMLLLCSDGLWNYAPHLEDLKALLEQIPDGTAAIVAARALVEFANSQGGRDNITVAIAHFGTTI